VRKAQEIGRQKTVKLFSLCHFFHGIDFCMSAPFDVSRPENGVSLEKMGRFYGSKLATPHLAYCSAIFRKHWAAPPKAINTKQVKHISENNQIVTN